MSKPIIIWFRQDLRLSDNPALIEACKNGPILPVFILDDENAGEWKKGGATRLWLHHALISLNEALSGTLVFKKGKAEVILKELVKETGAQSVYWNRCYEPWRIKRDKDIKENLGVECQSFNASLLWEPWTIKNQQGQPYKVFTPFYKKGCLNSETPRQPLQKPDNIKFAEYANRTAPEDLDLIPSQPRWDKKMLEHWDISEKGAIKRLHYFIDNGLEDYKDGRNYPSQDNVSRLSPYLHFGQISPHQVWHVSAHQGEKDHKDKDLAHFHSELGWREFSYNLLYNFPKITDEPLQEKFDDFPWATDMKALEKWQMGQTGYPIVDAAMRELWETGYMHNRCRMIVGSFLVKNMLLHWRDGEKWFWDTLFDADLANNSASWQWIAGCGADAAPYFRIFNPIMQSEKFDADGEYIKRWVPELKDIDNKTLHKPFEINADGYPKPMLDHHESRDRALAAYATIKG